MMTIGPLTGAEARAYRQPPNAARPVPRPASPRMNVKRKGRDKNMKVYGAAHRTPDLLGYFTCWRNYFAATASAQFEAISTFVFVPLVVEPTTVWPLIVVVLSAFTTAAH